MQSTTRKVASSNEYSKDPSDETGEGGLLMAAQCSNGTRR
jgi:hypothetical protein